MGVIRDGGIKAHQADSPGDYPWVFRSIFLGDIGLLIGPVLVRLLLQIPTNGLYGFHQDELVTPWWDAGIR